MCRFNSGVSFVRFLCYRVTPNQEPLVLLQARSLEGLQVLLEVRPQLRQMRGNFKSHWHTPYFPIELSE
jgi:hypothetical protein